MTYQSTPGTTRQPYPVKARRLTVVRVEELSPGMRRIVLTGDDLEPTLPIARLAVADHVKLVIPDETTGEVLLPTVGKHGIVRPEGVELVIRDYTIRAFDPQRRELSLDFVLHDHGPAGRWAIAASPGDPIGAMGPRGSTLYPTGYTRYVVAVDETGLPAAERWIEEAPENAALDVFVLVADASHERELPAHPGLRLRWLRRDAGDDLASAVAAAVPHDDGATFVWAAAEAAGMQPLRRHLREVAGLDRRSIDVHGYWKLGEAGHREPHGGDHDAARGGGRRGRTADDHDGTDAQTGRVRTAEAVIPAERVHLLEEPNHGVLAVRKPDGSIIATPMWFVHRDGKVRFTHTTERGKYRALQSDPHMTLLVVSPNDPNEYVELRGVLEEVVPDPTGEFFAILARRYGRWDGNPPSDVEHRVVLVMRVVRAFRG